MEKEFQKIIFLFVITITIVLVIIFVISNIIIGNETKNTIQARTVQINLLSKTLTSEINHSLDILISTSKSKQVENVSYADQISLSLHGIPENMDIQKRELARQ